MKPRIIIAAIVLVVLTIAYVARPRHTELQKIATQHAQAGEMAAPVFVRLDTIQLNIEKTHTIADADLDWALSLLGVRHPKGVDPNKIDEYQRLILSRLGGRKTLSPEQCTKIIRAVPPCLQSKNSLVKLSALSLLSSTKDTRIKPIVQPLVNDTDQSVSRAAKRVIAKRDT